MRTVNLQVDRLTIDPFIAARNPRRLVLNLPLDILEVLKPPIWDMMEFGPFWL
jgi:hypothetical protein